MNAYTPFKLQGKWLVIIISLIGSASIMRKLLGKASEIRWKNIEKS